MKIFGMSLDELSEKGGLFTAQEIYQQPKLWQKIWNQIESEQSSIIEFLDGISGFKRIILTGAGTSAFIGISLQGLFQKRFGVIAMAIPTTDILSHPNNYLMKDEPTLMISFARSGNSPESVAVAKLADEICLNCVHFIITCNPDGQLATYHSKHNKYNFTLPAEANDKSLAMTSSYTSMLLAGTLLAYIYDLANAKSSINSIVNYGEKSIAYYADEIKEVAKLNFKRAVFLGSGPLLGIATEAHLKLQELTDGRVICKNDSFLGFRHGPKAVIDESTLVVYFLSNNAHSYQYESDLVADMRKGSKPLMEIGISETKLDGLNISKVWTFSENGSQVDEEFWAVSSIVPIQILSFFTSLHLGLRPDNPSISGAITRVVEGVNIYDIQ
jgi:tagatose-6-phosphate ketose/aldose isomerase